ncbi:MAG: aminoacyl-tRNA hydrolase [Rhodothermales bacterium]|nr:aminoacyl-tRNA hydrolase [Rhodothermales bacterium]
MPRPKRIVLGLGNPGPEYADTRHNAGYLVADAVAERAGLTFEPARGHYTIAWGTWRGVPFGVAKTAGLYMNQSGTAVTKLLGHFGLDLQDLLVVYDDLALDLGQIRLRGKGGAGGHNGVQDVIEKASSANFPRLRVGIGSSFPRGHQVDYVLSPFAAGERPVVEEAVEAAAEAALVWVREGLTTAMNQYNRR